MSCPIQERQSCSGMQRWVLYFWDALCIATSIELLILFSHSAQVFQYNHAIFSCFDFFSSYQLTPFRTTFLSDYLSTSSLNLMFLLPPFWSLLPRSRRSVNPTLSYAAGRCGSASWSTRHRMGIRFADLPPVWIHFFLEASPPHSLHCGPGWSSCWTDSPASVFIVDVIVSCCMLVMRIVSLNPALPAPLYHHGVVWSYP